MLTFDENVFFSFGFMKPLLITEVKINLTQTTIQLHNNQFGKQLRNFGVILCHIQLNETCEIISLKNDYIVVRNDGTFIQ